MLCLMGVTQFLPLQGMAKLLETVQLVNKRMNPGLKVSGVVLTMFEDDDSVFAAMRAGARGYLLKGADQDEIVRAIRAAAAGEASERPTASATANNSDSITGRSSNRFTVSTNRTMTTITRMSR